MRHIGADRATHQHSEDQEVHMTDEHGNEENRRWQADAQTGDATPRTGEERYGSTGPDVSQGRLSLIHI